MPSQVQTNVFSYSTAASLGGQLSTDGKLTLRQVASANTTPQSVHFTYLQQSVVVNMTEPQRLYPLQCTYPFRPSLSRLVLSWAPVICLLSLLIFFLTGFRMIHPLFSVFIAVAAAGFFLMGEMLHQYGIKK